MTRSISNIMLLTLALAGALVGLPAGIEAAELGLDERVACQRAIEDVYWRHRLWPEQNPGPKPTLAAVLSETTLQAKVADTLRKSNALASLWERPITAGQLEVEIRHMAGNSKSPEMLREIWSALGDDPILVAECLARPLLADRLARNRYASDSRFHGALRATALEEVQRYDVPDWMPLMSGRYEETVWSRYEESGVDDRMLGREPGERRLGPEDWQESVARLAAGFGNRGSLAERVDGLPVGVLSPLQEDEERFYVVAVLEHQSDRLRVAMVEWVKRPFDAWWLETRSEVSESLPDPARVESLPEIVGETCAADTWRPMRHLPNGRAGHVAVWTGSEMVVWGNRDVFAAAEPGGRYDPALDVWHVISTTGHPEGNLVSTAVWTGREMVVWGGFHGTGSVTVVDSGARYDPLTDSWAPTSAAGPVPSPRGLHTTAWTGREMLVWGGCGNTNCSTLLDTGGRYDPSTDSWLPTTTVGAPGPRRFHASAWTGSEMVVWGGEGPGVFNTLDDGGRYNPATDSWMTMSPVGAPEARVLHTAVSTGSEVLIFGGCATPGCFQRIEKGGGTRYDLQSDSWSPMSLAGVPSARYRHSAIWTGSEMILHGGCTDDECSFQTTSGGRYDPGTDSWAATNTDGAPYRAVHTAVWTGNEMIVWGGCSGGECQSEHRQWGTLRSGGRFLDCDELRDAARRSSQPQRGVDRCRDDALGWSGRVWRWRPLRSGHRSLDGCQQARWHRTGPSDRALDGDGSPHLGWK